MAGTPEVLSGTFAGRYTIERELGRGATATVYLARDTLRGRSVAIKLMRPELAQSIGADRFLREIKVNEKLHHPHIVPVLDSGEHEGQLYFVLPQMEDGSLRQMMQREKQLPIEAAVTIARTIAEALDYAHQQKLIHRDVKPENILFTSGQACLADFGIARAVERVIDESTTETGLVRGTPAYMSPEQASGSKDYDGRSDVYSLATVLYEMLAGVPAFIGPTPEAVIAQRFQHLPRELRVYRPSVPAALEAVIQKALALAPADRYVTAAEFAQALEAAPRGPTIESRTSGSSIGFDTPKKLAFTGALTFAGLALVAVAFTSGRSILRPDAPGADTTMIAVFPFTGSISAGVIPPEDLVREALSRWSGITLVDRFLIADAIRQAGSAPHTHSAAVRIASSVGAGRFVRGEVGTTNIGRRVTVGLFGLDQPRPLFSTEATIRENSQSADSVYESLAQGLLLRSSGDATIPAVESSRSVPARQAFAIAMRALDDWDLDQVDSLLQNAIHYDRRYTAAVFWLAQVRAWNGRSAREWSAMAANAAASLGELPGRERGLAAALAALGAGQFEEACRQYGRLRDQNPRDFAAWYGLGRCIRDDIAVVRDVTSPTGWSYRSSYGRAAAAYAIAFKLLPSSYRSLQGGSFQRLRALLFADGDLLRPGIGLTPDTVRFVARAVWQGDSLALIPMTLSQVIVADSILGRAGIVRAVDQQRRVFRDIAAAWSNALPNSAGAKEAVAVSLELAGDPTAIDTIRLARRLVGSGPHAIRLGATEILLAAKFSFPDGVPELLTASALADSLLAARRYPTDEEAGYLAPVAALVGRCTDAARLVRQGTIAENSFVTIPRFLLADANALLAESLLGCRRGPLSQAATRISTRLAVDGAQRQLALRLLLGPTVRATFPIDAQLVRTLAGEDRLLNAQLDLVRGDTVRARNYLTQRQLRLWSARVGAADEFYPEARLWLAIGDTSAAIARIDSGFAMHSRQPPTSVGNAGLAVARAASIILAGELRSNLAAASGDSSHNRWSQAVRALRRPAGRIP